MTQRTLSEIIFVRLLKTAANRASERACNCEMAIFKYGDIFSHKRILLLNIELLILKIEWPHLNFAIYIGSTCSLVSFADLMSSC